MTAQHVVYMTQGGALWRGQAGKSESSNFAWAGPPALATFGVGRRLYADDHGWRHAGDLVPSNATAPSALSATVQIILDPLPNTAKYLPPRLAEFVVSSSSVSDSRKNRTFVDQFFQEAHQTRARIRLEGTDVSTAFSLLRDESLLLID